MGVPGTAAKPTPEGHSLGRTGLSKGESMKPYLKLWKRESKRGNPSYGGKLPSGEKVMLFKNDRKQSEKDPDLILYLAEEQTEKEQPFDGTL